MLKDAQWRLVQGRQRLRLVLGMRLISLVREGSDNNHTAEHHAERLTARACTDYASAFNTY